MTTKKAATDLEGPVTQYFALIRKLRNGDASSVDALMNMWADDGTFEFKGAKPVVGTFCGGMAIRTLYENRLKAVGMRMSLTAEDGVSKEVALGVVDTEVTSTRREGSRVLAGWRTTIGTKNSQGFDVSGSHVFTFRGGKIKSLVVSISPKAKESQLAALKMSDLAVQNVGRLSLAAWPVV